MDRHRIVNTGRDSTLRERLADPLAALSLNDVQVEDVRHTRPHDGPDDIEIREELLVCPGMRTPALVPGIEMPQLDAQHGRLELVQTGVDTDHLVFIFARRSMVTQHADALG